METALLQYTENLLIPACTFHQKCDNKTKGAIYEGGTGVKRDYPPPKKGYFYSSLAVIHHLVHKQDTRITEGVTPGGEHVALMTL